jgi:hypothetical protein
MQKTIHVVLALFIFFLIPACTSKPACPDQNESNRFFSPEDLEDAPALSAENTPFPLTAKIGRKTMDVDKIVTGPMCNDQWKGTVYVACNVQVMKWEEKPLFLKECNLQIEPNTVVYVAYHNNAAYYNGCSCHTNEQPSSNP